MDKIYFSNTFDVTNIAQKQTISIQSVTKQIFQSKNNS
jgi:hypothetical protein